MRESKDKYTSCDCQATLFLPTANSISHSSLHSSSSLSRRSCLPLCFFLPSDVMKLPSTPGIRSSIQGQAPLFHLGGLPSLPPLTLYEDDNSLSTGLVHTPWQILHIAETYSGEGWLEAQVYCWERLLASQKKHSECWGELTHRQRRLTANSSLESYLFGIWGPNLVNYPIVTFCAEVKFTFLARMRGLHQELCTLTDIGVSEMQ